MHLRSILLTLATAAIGVLAQCSNPAVRREWNELSSSEKNSYIQAIKTLAARPQIGQDNTDPNTMNIADFVNCHSRAAPWVHGSADFYPYHRAMMWKFEQAMNSVGWPGGIVYFDWPAVNQNWWTTDIFSKDYFGAASSNDPNNCVLDGQFAKGKYNVAQLDADIASYRPFTSSETCLRRCGYVGAAMTSPDELNARYSATLYSKFRGDIMTGDLRNDDYQFYHASGHVTMGGDGQKCDLGNGAVSPNDPIFWLHHGFVDKVWWRWQNRCDAFKRMYDGPLTPGDIVADPGQTLTANILQRVDTYGVTVLQMMDTQNGAPLCYTYTSSKSDLPMPAIQCPDAPPLPTATTAVSSATDPNATADPTGTSSVAAATTTISSVVLDDIWLMNAFKTLVKKAPAAAPAPPSFGIPGVPKFGNPNLSTSVAAGSGAIVFGRDENGTVADSNDAVATPAAVASIAAPSATETFNPTSDVNATSTVSALPSLSVNFNSTVISNSTVETNTTLTVEAIIRPQLNHTIIAKEDNSTIVKYEKTNQTVVIPENETVLYVYPGYVESVDEEGNLVRHHLKVKPVEYKKVHGAPQNVTWNDPCYRMYQMPIPDAFIHHHQLNMQHVRNVEAINRMKVDEWNVKNCGPAKV
ncbi:Di-copper centre-containing protein [Rhizoclosmatium globosum]|uniref:Di-copper centre-containing protein n=1 Tax=Rhizoclosmatium globosum TaxID=329046 RepID=A0A1Y2D0V7_9FUNG|nr:Di-copper centre-containing protein [Rhizoclosmatium globosum]|eukprot:ORY52890.1 Di-copper centre-containing protein [Rhizoclosmatium globosum]